jgi:enterochelin esterase-like enzyme
VLAFIRWLDHGWFQGVAHQGGTDGVELDVALAGRQVGVVVDRAGAQAPLPWREAAAVGAFDRLHGALVERAHQVGHTGRPLWRHQQMHVVRRQSIGMHGAARLRRDLGEQREAIQAVVVAEEAGIAIGSAPHDMRADPVKRQPGSAGHGVCDPPPPARSRASTEAANPPFDWAGRSSGLRPGLLNRRASALVHGDQMIRKRDLFCLTVLGLAHGVPQARAQAAVEWRTATVAAPRVSYQTFHSPAAGTRVSFHLYVPSAYAQPGGSRYPVVYWLHGSGGGVPGVVPLSRLVDAAIEAGKVPPMLVVFVNGLRMGMYVDWKSGSVPLETVIVRDLVGHIDATWRTIATREGRLLDGFSMGGYGAARLGFKYPELFRAVSMMGAGPLQETLTRTPRASGQRAEDLLQGVYGGDQANFKAVSPRRHAADNAARIARASRVRMVIGDRDETYANNRAFHEYLEALGIPHEWIVLPGVGHDPMAVIEGLGDRHWAFYRSAFG